MRNNSTDIKSLTKKSGLSVLALIGIILFVVFGMSGEGDPSAAAVSKQAAETKAAGFLQDQLGISTANASFVVFQSHTQLSGYLQKENLTQKFDRSFSQFPIDYFQVELSEEGGARRYLVDVSTRSGDVSGWEQIGLKPDAANNRDKKTAEAWLNAMGYEARQFIADFDPDSGQWIFENKRNPVGEAVLQIRIAVSHGQVSAFVPGFQLPASFTGWMDKQSGSAQIMSLVSLLLSLLMAVGAIIASVFYRGTASFFRGILLTAVFILTYVINNLNMYPGFKAVSGSGWDSLFSVFFMHFTIFLMAAAVYISLVAGDAMWKDWGKSKWSSWSEPDFGMQTLIAMVRGYLLCLFILGIQASLFSFAERYFHMWAVDDPSQSTYNNFWPALFPILAWAAAISEEAVYRLFGIALFKKLTRSTFLAVLIPSFFWALGHTAYPIYPVYTRLMEVTVLGLIFGFAFLKYGLMTTIFAHASMDSILMGFSLMYLGGAGNTAAGLFYIFSPALVAIAIYYLHKKFRKDPAPPAHAALR